MSAPIVACTLADALGPILREIHISMGAKTSLDLMENVSGEAELWVCYIHAHGRAFQGIAESPSRALMAANSDRQTFEEGAAKTALAA